MLGGELVSNLVYWGTIRIYPAALIMIIRLHGAADRVTKLVVPLVQKIAREGSDRNIVPLVPFSIRERNDSGFRRQQDAEWTRRTPRPGGTDSCNIGRVLPGESSRSDSPTPAICPTSTSMPTISKPPRLKSQPSTGMRHLQNSCPLHFRLHITDIALPVSA